MEGGNAPEVGKLYKQLVDHRYSPDVHDLYEEGILMVISLERFASTNSQWHAETNKFIQVPCEILQITFIDQDEHTQIFEGELEHELKWWNKTMVRADPQ